MMLNLIVQEAVKEIVDIRSCGKVRACKNLTKVEGSTKGATMLVEAVEIITC